MLKKERTAQAIPDLCYVSIYHPKIQNAPKSHTTKTQRKNNRTMQLEPPCPASTFVMMCFNHKNKRKLHQAKLTGAWAISVGKYFTLPTHQNTATRTAAYFRVPRLVPPYSLTHKPHEEIRGILLT